jgi:hypothetical protein
MSYAEPNKPTASRQFDRVQAAIWRRDDGENEASRPEFTITFSRSYKDANEEWHRTHGFTARDLPHLKLAVDWALRELLLADE